MPDAKTKFCETRWSVVLAAQSGEEVEAQEALADLCQVYWYPLYAFVRRSGHGSEDAEDLTQEFFTRLLATDWLVNIDREKGRFRTFLLASLKHFLANEWRRSQTLKRGRDIAVVSLDAEDRYGREPVDLDSPETLYDRRWAMIIIESVFRDLRDEMKASGKLMTYEALKELLSPDPQNISYVDAAKMLGTSEDAIKMSVYRLRKQFRHLLRSRVASTVRTSSDLEGELNSLHQILRRS